MSDFLVSLGKQHTGEDLLTLIKKPYGKRAPEGQFFDYDWGSIAVLEERLTRNENIITKNVTTFAWVGDLVVDLPDRFLELFINRLTRLQQLVENDRVSLEVDELFERLNGTFAIVLGNDKGFSIVTDLLSFVPVYLGKNKQGRISSFGTHPDLVRVLSDRGSSIDIVSVGEFLDKGHTLFPHTMYANVEQLKPATLYCGVFLNDKDLEMRSYTYWSTPEEINEAVDEHELAEELRMAVTAAVTRRCRGKVAVSLSGGLDSRLILAAVPQEVECIAVTFGNTLNREMLTARRVAKAYNREWFPLFRDKEFLARGAMHTIRLMGCESGWVYGQGIGFVEDIEELGVDTLLDGNGIDEYLKCFWAKDIVPVKRLGGLLPTEYVKVRFDYENIFSMFSKSHIRECVIEAMCARRRVFYNSNLDPNRTSMAELLKVYPHSHDDFCVGLQRLLPVRTCGADRRILDFGFKCPMELRLGNKIFMRAAMKIYGAGSRIPSANDGVKPGSSHWSRLAQRSVRKLQDRTTSVLEKIGKKARIQHSWHDYQTYWEESSKLADLIQEYGKNLDEFDGQVFQGRGLDLLECKDIDWQVGFRLLHLAVWKSVIEDYRP